MNWSSLFVGSEAEMQVVQKRIRPADGGVSI
jgi:hypothetical protein